MNKLGTVAMILVAGTVMSQMTTPVYSAPTRSAVAHGASGDLMESFTWSELAANVVGWAAGSAAGAAVATAVIGTPAAGPAALACAVAGGVAGGVADAVTQLWPFKEAELYRAAPPTILD
jgi:hypothetical protein